MMKKGIIIITIALSTILAILLAGPLQASVDQGINAIQQNYFLFVSRNMEELETEHFLIKYESSEEDAILAAQTAEKYYDSLCNQFEYKTNEKIPIIIYEDVEKMKKYAFMKTDNVPMGLYIGKTIQIISPDVWIDSNENKGLIFEKEGPIIHEMVHYIVDDITNGNYEEWFFEGMSLYAEYLYTGYVIGEGNLLNRDTYSLEELQNDFRKLDQIRAYYSSFKIIKDLAEEKNVEYLNNVLQYLSEGESLDEAFLI